MEMLIEACSALNSTIVDLTVETSIKFYKLVFHVFFPTQIFLQFFFQTYIIYYTSFFFNPILKFVFHMCCTSCVSSIRLVVLGLWGQHHFFFNDVLKPLLVSPSTLDADMKNVEDDDDNDDYEDIELDEFCM